MEYLFSESFGSGPKFNNHIEFSIDLTDEDVSYIKDYLKKNGPDCGYEEIEYDNPGLFDKINDTASQAVLKRINENRREFDEEELDFYEVDWGNIFFDFYWPEEFYDKR